MGRIFWVIVWTALFVGGALVDCRAEAQSDLAAPQLALAVARVCANERGLGSARPADCALIWQTARGHGRTSGERLAWLSAHSSCVLTDRPFRAHEAEGNCVWTRHLLASDEQPEGWRASAGPWAIGWRSRWARMRAYCAALVAGQRPRGGWPCSRAPDTWGGREIDHARAIAAGMTPLGCVGTANEGYLYAVRP